MLWSFSLNVGIFWFFSSSSRMPRAMRATMPCPFGGCSHTSTPCGLGVSLVWPSIPLLLTEPMFWPLNLRDIGSVGSEPVSA